MAQKQQQSLRRSRDKKQILLPNTDSAYAVRFSFIDGSGQEGARPSMLWKGIGLCTKPISCYDALRDDTTTTGRGGKVQVWGATGEEKGERWRNKR